MSETNLEHLSNGYVRVTSGDDSAYFCRKCGSINELSEPYCSCRVRNFFLGVFLILFIIAPGAAVAVHLIRGALS